MNKFIYKTSLFILPFLLSYFTIIVFDKQEKGDLIRMGNFFNNRDNYRKSFKDAFSKDIDYTLLSELDNKKTFDILTIGDSFSQQKGYGYQNYLAKDFELLHFDESCNSMQILHNLIKGDVFDTLNIKYVLIQSVKRFIVQRSENIDTSTALTLIDFKDNFIPQKRQNYSSPKFFSSKIIKFPMTYFFNFIDDNAFYSSVYQVKTTRQLFSTGDKELLFYDQELSRLKKNNKKEQVEGLNKELNILSKKLENKGIKLIVLPSPDKYDIYYDYLNNKKKYPKPLFFEYLSACKKDYIYIDAKQILSEILDSKKDVYFYDDTHWSPVASEILATKIINKIKINENIK